MNPTLSSSSPCLAFLPLKPLSSSSSSAPFLAFPSPKPLTLRAYSATPDSVSVSKPNTKNPSFARKLQSFSKTAVLVGAAVLMVGKLSNFPAKADSAPTLVEQEPAFLEEKEAEENQTSPLLPPMIAQEDVFHKEKQGEKTQDPKPNQTPSLSEFLESDEDVIEAMKSLIYQKIENYEDEEALSILSRLVSAQPNVTDWKFLFGRLLGDMGQTEKARKVFEEVLQSNPFSYETLFENALLMDRCGEGEAVFKRLEELLALAREEKRVNEARDVRFIMAYLHFLHNNVDLALMSYQELAEEDPSDYKPYFCRGVIYKTLDMNDEAEEQFVKYDKLSPRRYQPEEHWSRRTPSSKTRNVRRR
ncbi:SLOW GREEN 1 [Hibiscus trionum]|uniref:SLOW GREEN 1 n=1 Tax=Hibiscus trionum TaxID=183268 RepID=A0A9W7I3Q7_HIBTR|nr:SLOW GREEN 1 [Hibiscus trionum]